MHSVQTFQTAQTAAQNLATTINTSPGTVFKMLVAQSIHGRVQGVMIWGPSAAPPSGMCLLQRHTFGLLLILSHVCILMANTTA